MEGCKTGFTQYDGPTGCVRNVCNEDLAALKDVDAKAVADAMDQMDIYRYVPLTTTKSPEEIHNEISEICYKGDGLYPDYSSNCKNYFECKDYDSEYEKVYTKI